MNKRGLFITGTDTDVGKTVVSTALLHALRQHGYKAVGMKPVASGCAATEQGWRNADALALQAASYPVPDYELANPFALPEPTAPQVAAARAGIVISLPPILAAYRQLAAQTDVMVVEGVGGWLAPLTDQLDQNAFVQALELEVILVVGLRLGCINHARLTERSIVRDGGRLVGWVGNTVDNRLSFATEYFQTLQRMLSAPCLGLVPFAPEADPAMLAGYLNTSF